MMGMQILIHTSTMENASHWPLYLHPKLTKLNQGREVRKAPTRVTWEGSTISKSKCQIALLMVKPNTNEGVEPLALKAHHELQHKIPKEHVPKVALCIKMMLGERYEGVQATSGTSFEYDEFDLSCDTTTTTTPCVGPAFAGYGEIQL